MSRNQCDLWNRLGYADQITRSEIGPNFAISGSPDYSDVKYYTGIRIDASDEDVTIANTPFDFAIGCMEIWIKIPYSVSNGVPSDAGTHYFFDWPYFANAQKIYFHSSGTVWIIADGSTHTWTCTHVNMDISANTSTHIAFVWDNTDASKKRRIFLSGVEIDSENTAFNDIDMSSATFQLGARLSSEFDGYIDNIKWWNYAKTDFSDRFYEGFSGRRKMRRVS